MRCLWLLPRRLRLGQPPILARDAPGCLGVDSFAPLALDA
jgi:hypothetical protein